MGVVEATQSGSITLLLAVIVTILLTAVGALFWLLVGELRKRAARAEGLTDKMAGSYDTLAAATDKAADVAEAALEELRRSKR